MTCSQTQKYICSDLILCDLNATIDKNTSYTLPVFKTEYGHITILKIFNYIAVTFRCLPLVLYETNNIVRSVAHCTPQTFENVLSSVARMSFLVVCLILLSLLLSARPEQPRHFNLFNRLKPCFMYHSGMETNVLKS